MELLSILGADIQILPDRAYIPYDQRLHPVSVEGGNQSARRLVLDLFDLIFEFLELFLLGSDQFFTTTRAFLLRIDLLIELCYELVAILPLRPQETPIEEIGLLAIM